MSSQGTLHEQTKCDDKQWPFVMAARQQGGAWQRASGCLSAECVWLSSTCFLLGSSAVLHSHLPVGECGVPPALPCVPTPWPWLFDIANINRCCGVTGSGRLLRGWWKRSCSSLWQRAAMRSRYGRKRRSICVCVQWKEPVTNGPRPPLSGLNSRLHLVGLYSSNLTDPQYQQHCKSIAEERVGWVIECRTMRGSNRVREITEAWCPI